jgi:hypothetical protein
LNPFLISYSGIFSEFFYWVLIGVAISRFLLQVVGAISDGPINNYGYLFLYFESMVLGQQQENIDLPTRESVM